MEEKTEGTVQMNLQRIIEQIESDPLSESDVLDTPDSEEKRKFEIYRKGFNAGVLVERERILELIKQEGEVNE